MNGKVQNTKQVCMAVSCFLEKSRHFRSRNANSERGEMTKLRMLELKILHSIIIVGLFSFPLREH